MLLSAKIDGTVTYPIPVRPSMRELSWAAIFANATAGLIHDVYRAYVMANLDHLEFRVAAIPSDLEDAPRPGIFNPEKMERLFQVGFAAAGVPWKSIPQGMSVEEILKQMP